VRRFVEHGQEHLEQVRQVLSAFEERGG
jgi:hypothetical protein